MPSSEQATCIEHYTQQLENTDSFQEHMQNNEKDGENKQDKKNSTFNLTV